MVGGADVGRDSMFHRLNLREDAPAFFEEWDSASKLAKAFGIGKFESAAVFCLTTKTPAAAVEALRAAVRSRGMRMFLLHETIAKEIFCNAFTSGVGPLSMWEEQLTNLDDGEHKLVLRP